MVDIRVTLREESSTNGFVNGHSMIHSRYMPSISADGSDSLDELVTMQGVEAFHREISAKGYRYMRPGLETMPWGTLETGVIDPFGNLIRFCQPTGQPAAP